MNKRINWMRRLKVGSTALLGNFIRSAGNQQQMDQGGVQSDLQVLDSKDCERLHLPLEYAGKYIRKLNFGGYGFGTYQILDEPPNTSSVKTQRSFGSGLRMSTWIRSMRISLANAIMPNDQAHPQPPTATPERKEDNR